MHLVRIVSLIVDILPNASFCASARELMQMLKVDAYREKKSQRWAAIGFLIALGPNYSIHVIYYV